MQRTWEIAFKIINNKMVHGSKFDHTQYFTLSDPQTSHRSVEAETSMRNQTERPLIQKDAKFILGTQQTVGPTNISGQIQQFYQEQFENEVDFHHRVAYRFEKAYRLSKKNKSRLTTLNLEVIDCISEFSEYID